MKSIPTTANPLFTRPVIGSAILLVVIFGLTFYVVQKYRRPGAMTPVEAQSMQMELPAPAGTAPVELATVERGRIENSVRYSGQAVGFVEEEVTPRVTGTITAMPVYVGSPVRRGEIIARLDTSQSAPVVANQRAGLNMALQGVNVARKDYEQALAAIREAHAEVGIRRSGLEGAKADVKAAQEERDTAQAQLEAAQSVVPDADAQLAAARSDQRYWQQEIEREQSLLKARAVTQEEYQRERAQADNAEAKVQQAQSRIVQVQAQVRAAQSAVRKAEAMIASAESKIDQMQAELKAHDAHVGSSDAMAASAQQKIAQAQAGVEQARAALAAASATQGYSEIRAQTDGVVTQRVVSPGVLVNPGQVILRIAQVAPIRLQANVAEADLARVHVGSQVLVSARSGEGRPTRAQITSIAPQIDPTTRTGIVEAILPNRESPNRDSRFLDSRFLDSRFLPGQYVTMEIVTGVSTNALLVPTGAIRYHTPPSGKVLSGQSVPTVWVAAPAVGSAVGQEGEYTVQEVVVRAGLSDRTKTEILSGLKEGQKIVFAGQDYLKSGDSVRPVAPLTSDTDPHTLPITSPSAMGSPVAPSAPHKLYTCLMHPEVIQDHPGNCPKCGMKLVEKRGAR